MIFSPDALQKIITDTLPATTDTWHTHAVIGTVDANGAQVVASFTRKLDNQSGFNWELQAAARHEWTGDNTVGAKVLLRW